MMQAANSGAASLTPAKATVAGALPPMTALQAVVAMGAFSLATLAPQLGLSLAQLGLLHTLLFGLGALGSLSAGRWIQWLGDTRTAAVCAALVAVAMVPLAWWPSLQGGAAPWTMWLAIVLLGLAYGPETPASVAVLTRATPAEQRPWVFSIRQTGNQIGAMTGSLALPWLSKMSAGLPFGFVALLAGMTAWWCASVPKARVLPGAAIAADASRGPQQGMLASLHEVWSRPALRRLAVATCAFSAMQMCLNTFLITHVVSDWRWTVARAASFVALMQAGGFVGRLLWGWVARRVNARKERSILLLGLLGMAMALSCAVLVLGRPFLGETALWALAFGLGLAASGWNGVMIAEVARRAGPPAAAAVTGAVLMFGYSGLALAPGIFAWIGSLWGTSTSYLLLAAAALMAALPLLAERSRP